MKLAPIDARIWFSFHPWWMTSEKIPNPYAPLNSSPGAWNHEGAPLRCLFEGRASIRRLWHFPSFFFFFFLRCPVGKYWHFHGERCNELVSLPVDPAIIAACLVGSLCLICAVIGVLLFINKKCSNTRKTIAVVWVHHDPRFPPFQVFVSRDVISFTL